MFPSEALANLSEPAALWVGEPEFSRELGVEDPSFRYRVFAPGEQALRGIVVY
jgi:hypothetical protein